MQKKCSACGSPFQLSGSGKRQKFCPECRKRGVGQRRGLSASKALNIKGAGNHFSAPIPPHQWEQIEARKDQPNPISFTTPGGVKCRVWLASDAAGNKIIGDDVWWRVNVLDQQKRERRTSKWNPIAKALNMPITVVGRNEPIKNMDDALGVLKGFRVRVGIDAEKELQVLGCGWRMVTCQFRRGKVLLHHAGNTATMKRAAFKAFVASNKRRRRKPPSLRLVISNPATRSGEREAA